MKNDGFLSIAGIVLCMATYGACSSSSKETRHSEQVQSVQKDGQAQSETQEHDVDGPEVFLDFDVPELGVPLSDGKDGLPAHGPLRSARVKGPKTKDIVETVKAEQKENDTVVAKAEVKTEKQSAPALSCAFGGWLWGLAALGAVYFAIRILKRAS